MDDIEVEAPPQIEADVDDDDEADQPAVLFALTPARAVPNVLDYSTKRGSDIYKIATSPLREGDRFDVESKDLNPFLKDVRKRANEQGWDDEFSGILSIPDDPEDPNECVDLIDKYGDVTIEQIRANEVSYVATPSRAAQDSHNLYMALWSALSKAGKNKVAKKITW